MKHSDNIGKKLFFSRLTVLLVLLCAFGTSSVMAQNYYVFQNGTYGFITNNNNGTVTASTTFSPAAVWIAGATMGNTSTTLQSYSNTSQYLNGSASNNGSVTIGNSASVWQNRTYLCTRSYGGTNYYVKYSGTSFTTASGENGNRFSAYSTTITDKAAEFSTALTISGTAVISATGQYEYTHTNVKGTPAYTNYRFNNTDHYFDENGTSLASVPTSVSYNSYAWSVSGAGASRVSINSSTGVLTVNSLPSSGQEELTVTCTASYTGAPNVVKSQTVYLSSTGNVSITGMYVISNGGSNYLGGSSTTNITTFNPTTCLWTGTSGGTWQNSAGYYLSYSGTNYNYTFSLATSGTNWTVGGTENGTTGQTLLSTRNNYYLRYSNGWSVSNTNYGRSILFSVTKKIIAEQSTAPTISGPSEISELATSAGTFSRTTNAAYTMGYINYVFYNNANHYFKTDNTTSLSAAPTAESFTYTWSLEGIASTYAEINSSTGVINYKSYPDADTQATVKLTATSTNKTFTVTQAVTFKASPAPTALSVTPASLVCYVGQTNTFTYTLTPTNAYNDVVAIPADNTKFTASVTPGANGTGTITVTGVSATTSALNLVVNAKDRAGNTAQTKTVTVTVKNICATPTISFDNSNNKVTISTATGSAVIYYTTNGSNPTTASTQYSSPFVLNSAATVKAIAVRSNYDDSQVATLAVAKVAAPSITQNGTQVQISSATQGATIHYTTNGDTPSASSPVYGSALTGLASGSTVKAMAVKAQNINSDVSTFVYREQVPAPTITFTPNGTGATATASFSCTLAGVTYYYTVNGAEPTTSSTAYTAPFEVNDADVVKVIAAKAEYNNSVVVSQQYSSRKTATPAIVISGSNVTFTCSETADFYYTTNGDDPTTSSTKWNGTAFSPANESVIKVIAVAVGASPSEIVQTQFFIEGSSGGTVYLNDLEDHNWTYYLPNGGINSDYNYPAKLCSPYPRNVKITYYGNGLVYTGADGGSTATATGVQVSKDETENTFVYYKTLERDANNRFPYELIPNPFSKRPTYTSDATTQWRGFYKWRVKSVTGGTIYNASSGGTAQAVGALLDADTEYYFQPTDNSQTNANNAISMQVELEAVWARAYRVACAVGAISTNTSSSTFTGGSVERNFLVVNSGTNSNTAINNTSQKPVTIMMVEPDFSSDYRTNTRYINPLVIHANADLKLEYMNINGVSGDNVTSTYYTNYGTNSTMFWAGTKNLTLGRGLANTTSGGLVGYNISGYKSEVTAGNKTYSGSGGLNYHVRVESGVYNFMTTTQQWKEIYYDGSIKIRATWGCDYDRAKNDNSRLIVKRMVLCGNGTRFTSSVNKGVETIRQTLKSGTLNSEMSVAGGDMENSTYFGICGWHTNSYTGCRTIIMEGGEVSNLCGGSDRDGASISNTDESVRVRIKGGKVRGCIYGGATSTMSIGTRSIIMTGGEVNGWISGGNNGIAATEGELDGMTYVYIGGNAEVNSNGSTTLINRALGGNVFGSGCGYSSSSTSGKVDLGSNVVVADNSYIERGVYGGGSFGFNETTSNIYITGGHIEGKSGGVSSAGTAYDANIKGGVYGGACQNKGGTTNIYMTGGVVEGGIYGGSNSSGTLSGGTNLFINGGQVGTSGTNANVHGGGYGASTVVSGDVNVTMGVLGVTGAQINGSVYGGGAQGTVKGKSVVTVNSGSCTGDIYGGGLGTSGNSTNGVIDGAITVTVNGTDPAPDGETYAIHGVYGGGNFAPAKSTPTVTVNNCDNSIEYVYGGGNAATVPGTSVTIHGGNVIGNVFGGCNNANVTSSGTNVLVDGGTILNVFGGNNNGGSITGALKVKVSEAESATCPVNISALYGGGNKAASAAGSIDIECATRIDTVFGGAKAANINGNIDLLVKAGNIGNVFGGNNLGGTISGTITVTANWDDAFTCSRSLGNVYGGGNLAAYTGSPTVNILNCTTTGSVFGGGKGSSATVTGNPTVNIGDWTTSHLAHIGGNVFGGGDEAPLEGTTNVTIRDCNTIVDGDVYGGGNATYTNGNNLIVWGGTINRLFGGGNGIVKAANVNGNATTSLYGGTFQSVFGGSNTNGDVTGTCTLLIDQNVSCTETGASNCGEFNAVEVYGAGNEAYLNGEIDFQIKCITQIDNLYGGAKNADIGQGAKLNITSGSFGKVFGGNNLGGTIGGAIEVNIEETGCSPIKIGELYGCGNQAPYSVPSGMADPTVNVLSCTSIDKVFGGGLGTAAVVTGNPTVNIQLSKGAYASQIGDKVGSIGIVYGGGNQAAVAGTTHVNIKNCNAVIDTIYGGGNLASVTGTDVVVWGGDITTAFGGGYKSNVNGNTSLTIHGGTIDQVFAGNNESGTVTGTMNLNIDPKAESGSGSPCSFDIDEVYGGGNHADGNSGVINIACCEYPLGNVYGGAKAAKINGDITLNVKGGIIDNVFGGNNESGSIGGKITVNIDMNDCGSVKNVYGGGNLAPYTAPAATPNYPEVNLLSGTIGLAPDSSTGNVFGGGLGASAIVTGNPHVNLKQSDGQTCTVLSSIYGGGDAAGVTGNPTIVTTKGTVKKNVYGGGREADVTGVTSVMIQGDSKVNGNVYGGGNRGVVNGKTNVQIGQ